MNKPIIAIDIDDTIADSTESVRLLTNKLHNTNVPAEAYKVDHGTYWGYYERVWEEYGLAEKATVSDYTDEMVKDQSFVPLLPGALFAIKQLAQKYSVILVTSRDKSWDRPTKEWLAQRLPNIPIEVYFTDSHHNTDDLTKGQLCVKLGAFILIDDNVNHCLSALNEGLKAILYGEYGWHGDAPDYLVRCRDWQMVLEYLDGQS